MIDERDDVDPARTGGPGWPRAARRAERGRSAVLGGVLAAAVLSLAACSGSATESLPPPSAPTATIPGTASVGSSGPSAAASGASSPGSSSSGAPSSGGASSGASVPTSSAAGSLPPAPTLPAVPGYSYTTAPAAVVKAFAGTGGSGGVLSPATVRSLRKGKDPVGSVAARALASAHVGDTALENSLAQGIVTGLDSKGYTVRNRSISGTNVLVATAKGSTVVAWYHRGLVLQVVSSRSLDVVLAYTSACLKTA